MTESIQKKSAVSRRNFLAGAGASAVAFSIVKPELVHGADANNKVKIGLIACGGRGTWISKFFQQHGGYQLTAVADYFEDRISQYGDMFDIPAANRFTGLSGYKRMLDKKLVDAIVIESPPYFHPEQAAAGVEAGVHVYTAKPIAVDVPGCLTMEESGKKATQKKLCFQVDFQTRANPFYQEAIKRIHEGAIGDYVFGESSYHAGFPFERQLEYWKEIKNDPSMRIRAWGLDKALSGDIITEQNIHTLDVCSWIMNAAPVKAWGLCGLRMRQVGECHEWFTITYEYPGSIGISFSSRQFEGFGTKYEGIRNRMFGTTGEIETEYGGEVVIRGKNPYAGGNTGDIFSDGVAANVATFHKSITEGNYANPTVAPSVRSNLVTVLGRTAAYKKEVVTWDEIMKNKEKLEANLKGLKD